MLEIGTLEKKVHGLETVESVIEKDRGHVYEGDGVFIKGLQFWYWEWHFRPVMTDDAIRESDDAIRESAGQQIDICFLLVVTLSSPCTSQIVHSMKLFITLHITVKK